MGIISRLRKEFKLLSYVLMPDRGSSEYSLYLYWVNKINPVKHRAALKSAAREKRGLYGVKLREVITTGSDGKTIWMPLLLIKYYGTVRRVFINAQSIGKVRRISNVFITNFSFEHNIFVRNHLKDLEIGLNRILDDCWQKYPDIEWTPEEFENALIKVAVTSTPEDYWKMKT